MAPPRLVTCSILTSAGVSKTLERFGVREAEAPDVTQEVFVVVHAHLASYDAPAATVALRDCIPHREAVASAGTAST